MRAMLWHDKLPMRIFALLWSAFIWSAGPPAMQSAGGFYRSQRLNYHLMKLIFYSSFIEVGAFFDERKIGIGWEEDRK